MDLIDLPRVWKEENSIISSLIMVILPKISGAAWNLARLPCQAYLSTAYVELGPASEIFSDEMGLGPAHPVEEYGGLDQRGAGPRSRARHQTRHGPHRRRRRLRGGEGERRRRGNGGRQVGGGCGVRGAGLLPLRGAASQRGVPRRRRAPRPPLLALHPRPPLPPPPHLVSPLSLSSVSFC